MKKQSFKVHFRIIYNVIAGESSYFLSKKSFILFFIFTEVWDKRPKPSTDVIDEFNFDELMRRGISNSKGRVRKAVLKAKRAGSKPA
jgi:hypothetical protein